MGCQIAHKNVNRKIAVHITMQTQMQIAIYDAQYTTSIMHGSYLVVFSFG